MTSELQNMAIALVGIPYDEKSSFLRGAAAAPDKIRSVLNGGSSNYFSELGVDILAGNALSDRGNLEVGDYLALESQVAPFLDEGLRGLFLGGDHSISYPIVKALNRQLGPFNILHFDAHPDLYQEYEGDHHCHACPFARIMEEGLASRLVQVGIRTLNKHQKEQAERFQVEMIQMKDFPAREPFDFTSPVYISVDMDALDPAFAPGVSHRESGGLSVRDILDVIHGLTVPVIGADIVEFNPERDVADLTASVAAKLLKEIAGKMIQL